jgi:NADH/NAD ratio-sensing transcriptional regulator Rex
VDDLKPSSGVGLEAEKLPLNFPNCRTPLYERGLRELENIGVEPVSTDDLSEKLATELSGV